MINRRNFIKGSGAMTLGSLLIPNVMKGTGFQGIQHVAEIGIQTFTTRSFTGSDPRAMFQELANIGFKNIETYTHMNPAYYGFKPIELKSIIEDLGMKWISHHVAGVPIDVLMSSFLPEDASPEQKKQVEQMVQKASELGLTNLTDNTQQLADEAAEGGLEYLVCGGTVLGTMKEIDSAVDLFSKAGEACKSAGLQFAYHNHESEWDPIEGSTAYDLILSQTDKDLVKMELDLGWAALGKKDPIELFKGHPGRFPLFHVKDFNLETNTIVPVGEGTIDFTSAFKNADLAGMKYFFYEQDTARSMEEVKQSYNKLKTIVSH